MPSRKFDTNIWNEPWFQEYTANEKLLYIYLSRNNDCSACGIYTLTIKDMANRLDLPTSQVEKALRGLEPRVLYDRRLCLVFYRHFVTEQRNSKSWMDSVEKAIASLKPHLFIAEFMQENQRFMIACPHPADSLLTGPDTDTDSEPDLFKEGGMGGEDQPPAPPAPQEAHDPLMARFLKFWAAYPHKRSKGQAETTWKKLKPDEQLLERMLKALEQARTSAEWTNEDGSLRKKWIPYPSTWLNDKGWEDEHTQHQKGGAYAKGGQRIREPGYDD